MSVNLILRFCLTSTSGAVLGQLVSRTCLAVEWPLLKIKIICLLRGSGPGSLRCWGLNINMHEPKTNAPDIPWIPKFFGSDFEVKSKKKGNPQAITRLKTVVSKACVNFFLPFTWVITLEICNQKKLRLKKGSWLRSIEGTPLVWPSGSLSRMVQLRCS